jgi:hypothetical protein
MTLTRVLSMVAGSFELLYGDMRVLREEYDIPVIVTHGCRPIAAIRFNEAASKQQLRALVLVREEEGVCEKRNGRYIAQAFSLRKAQRPPPRRVGNLVRR